jgi:hypothetical protein
MTTFSLNHFDDFLTIAQQQTAPQTLLLVLAKRELPEGYTAEQEKHFLAGTGGHLAPLSSIAKHVQELDDFTDLATEATDVSDDWDALFVAAIDRLNDTQEAGKKIDKLLDKMVNDIRAGLVGQFLTFDKQGVPLTLEHG